jgi:hypothetical protein
MTIDGDQRILRARRVETAGGPIHRGDDRSIQPQQRQDQQSRQTGDETHRGHDATAERRSTAESALSRSEARSAPAEAAAGFARTTTSDPAGSLSSLERVRWRSRRLTRFRTTDPPTALDTTNPTLAGADETASGRRCTTRVRRPARLPPRTATVNSPPVRIRWVAGSTRSTATGQVRRRARRGPYGDEPRGWRDRLACACAAGSRASWLGAGCWAGTSACSREDSRFVTAGRPGHCDYRHHSHRATPTSIGRPRNCVGTRREVAVKPSHGTGVLPTGSNQRARTGRPV